MANGEITSEAHGKLVKRGYQGCIALSRKLAKDLGLKSGKGQYDYAFGSIIVIDGVGKFVFKDLMPKKWDYHDNGYRVDIWFPTLKGCRVFGVKRCNVRVEKEN